MHLAFRLRLQIMSFVFCLWWIGEKGFEASETSKLGGDIGCLFSGDQREQAKAKSSAFGKVLHLLFLSSCNLHLLI